MRRLRLRSAALGLALVIAPPASVAGCGCPVGLMSGVLVAQGPTLAVDTGSDVGGDVTPIRWPFGHGVRPEGGRLVLTDLFGAIKAREGDHVALGGGEGSDDTFVVFGQIEVTEAALR